MEHVSHMSRNVGSFIFFSSKKPYVCDYNNRTFLYTIRNSSSCQGNMRKGHVLFSIVSVFLLLGTGIGFYVNTSQRNNPSTDEALGITHAYKVTWKTTSMETSHMKGFAGKDSDYVNTISFDQPNLKELRFTLNWTDDKATGT